MLPKRSEHSRSLLRSTLNSILILTLLLPVSCATVAPNTVMTKQAWEAQIGKAALDNPAYAFVEDDPTLPSVLIIGDSISIAYTEPVRAMLEGKANVHRIPVNGGNTQRGLDNLEVWLGDRKWDVIHFNWGLHDLKRVDANNKLDVTKERAVSPEAYGENLRALVKRLKKTKASLVWATTTPVPEGAGGRIPGDEVEYNAIAKSIMKRKGIAINDLHTHILPRLDELQRPANVHFHPPGSQFLAEQVIREINIAL